MGAADSSVPGWEGLEGMSDRVTWGLWSPWGSGVRELELDINAKFWLYILELLMNVSDRISPKFLNIFGVVSLLKSHGCTRYFWVLLFLLRRCYSGNEPWAYLHTDLISTT